MNPLRPVKAILKKIRRETADVKTYTVQVGEEFPGELSPGQFNMVGYPGVGEAPLSFSSLRDDGCIEHTVRVVGAVTASIDKMTEGDELLLRGPYGQGWPMDRAGAGDLLLVAGGLGLAPLRPVIREVLKNRDSFGDVFLLYGARNEKNLLFMDEYEAWRKAISFHLTVDELVTGERWSHSVGLITGLLDSVKFGGGKTQAFVVGPEMMMRFVCRGLMMRGVHPSKISVSLERRMKCGIAQCGHCQHVGFFVCKDGPVFTYKEVAGLMDGLL